MIGSVHALSDVGSVTPPQWVGSVVAIAVSIVVGLITRAVIRRFGHREHNGSSTVRVLAQVVFGLIVALGVYVGLRVVGIDPAPLLAGAGILGITLAFALRDIAENYISGILMGLRNPFRPGDQIISGAFEGTVEDLNLRYTTLRTYDGVRVLLPNGQVLQSPLVNLTVNGSRRTDFALGVAYGTDLAQAARISIDAVTGIDGIDPRKETQAWVESLDASWITIRVRFWHAPEIAEMWKVRSAVIVAVTSAMDAAGIELPFERSTIEVVTPSGPAGSGAGTSSAAEL